MSHICISYIYICMYPIYTYLPSPSALWFFDVWLIYMCSCMPCHLTHTCVYVCVIYIYVLHMYVAQICVMRICETNLPHPCHASHDNLSMSVLTVYMHTCMYVSWSICIHIHMHTYVYMYIYRCMYTYRFTLVYTYLLCIRTYIWYIHTMHTWADMCTCICIHISYMCIYNCVRTHVRMFCHTLCCNFSTYNHCQAWYLDKVYVCMQACVMLPCLHTVYTSISALQIRGIPYNAHVAHTKRFNRLSPWHAQTNMEQCVFVLLFFLCLCMHTYFFVFVYICMYIIDNTKPKWWWWVTKT